MDTAEGVFVLVIKKVMQFNISVKTSNSRIDILVLIFLTFLIYNKGINALNNIMPSDFKIKYPGYTAMYSLHSGIV
ncbi:MAG: hypothetical protein IJ759_01345 [Bacteroidales bacterium]|nr:hypothetical protein [Bacteroidales bacterium]